MATAVPRPGNAFDFNKLCETFSKICPDFLQNHATEMSQSSDFAYKVLFNLSPKMRQIKQSGTAQMWRLTFKGDASVFIYTYTFKNPINVRPRLQDNKLYLTLKQAGLLAVSKLCSLLPAQHNPRDKILLTPLARAVFLPQNISKITVDLTALVGRTVDTTEVVKAVISSCQTDGFHLQHSQCHIALVAIDVTVTVAALRQKLRSKTIRLYEKHGKTYDAKQYAIYAQHSKLASRAPDTEPLPQPSTSNQGNPNKTQDKSLSSVLRSIVKSVDDPLSGDTLELDFIAPPAPKSEVELPTPIDVQVGATSLAAIRTAQVAATVAHNRPTRVRSNYTLEDEAFTLEDDLFSLQNDPFSLEDELRECTLVDDLFSIQDELRDCTLEDDLFSIQDEL